MFTGVKPKRNTTQEDDDADKEHVSCCPKDGCIKSFSNPAELEFQTSGEKHKVISESNNLGQLDKTKLSYATNGLWNMWNVTIRQQLPTNNS